MLKLLDRAGGLVNSAAPIGTGTLLIASDLTAYQPLANVGNNNTFYYLARHRTQDEWEVGLGTIQVSGLFTYVQRTRVFDGTNGPDVLTSFSSGLVDVVSVYPAALISSLNAINTNAPGFLVAVSSGVLALRSLANGMGVSIENATGVSGNPIIGLDSTGFPPGNYGSGTQVPTFTVDAGGRITNVSLAAVGVSGEAVTSIETSVSSFLGKAATGGTYSLFLDYSSLEGRLDTRYAQSAAVSSAIVSTTGVLGTSIANTNAALVSVTNVLGTSIGNTNAAVTSVAATVTSVGLATVSINTRIGELATSIGTTNAAITSVNTRIGDLATSIGNSNAAITSINAVAVFTNANNAFTGNNSFAAVTSVSTLRATGPVRVSANTWTPIFQLTDATSIAVDMSRSNDFVVTLGGNRTVEAPTNLQGGQSGVIFIHQDGTGGRTLAWNGVWRFPASTAPTITATSSARDVIAYEVYTSTLIVANAVQNV